MQSSTLPIISVCRWAARLQHSMRPGMLLPAGYPPRWVLRDNPPLPRRQRPAGADETPTLRWLHLHVPELHAAGVPIDHVPLCPTREFPLRWCLPHRLSSICSIFCRHVVCTPTCFQKDTWRSIISYFLVLFCSTSYESCAQAFPENLKGCAIFFLNFGSILLWFVITCPSIWKWSNGQSGHVKSGGEG